MPGDTRIPEVYFEDLTDQLALRFYTMTKFNSLNIIKEDARLILEPNGLTNLGIGFNYKFVGIGLSVGLPVSQSKIDKFGKTTSYDIQLSIYSRLFGFDGYLQGYKGYYLENPEDFVDWQELYQPQLPDMRVLSIGLSAFYIFNNKKFSYKAAYQKTQVQKKSAGSFTLGIFANYDAAQTDNGFIPVELNDSINSDFDLKEFDMISGGISVGYMYTFVIKENFSLNITLIPGFGLQKVAATALDGTGGIETQPAAQFLARASLGYEFNWFYLGFTASNIWRNFSYKDYELDLGTEQFRFIIGKRFDVGGKKKR